MIIIMTKTFTKKEIRDELLKLDQKDKIILSKIESSKQFDYIVDWMYKDNLESIQTYDDMFDPDLIQEFIKSAKRRYPL